MRFICFCDYDTKKFKTLSPAELEALGPACQPHDKQLRASGLPRLALLSLLSNIARFLSTHR